MVSIFTTKVEYITCAEAVKEALWIRGLASRLKVCQGAVKVICDNQS